MLATALCSNRVLTDLNLADNPFGSAGGLPSFSSVVAIPPVLTRAVSRAGLCQLSEGLSGNHGLTALSCENCAAGAWGAGPLAEGLQHNTTLRKLNLSKNCMVCECDDASYASVTLIFACKQGAEGAALLAFALNSNSVLDTLDLRGDDKCEAYFASRFRPGQLGKQGQIKLVGSWGLLFDACRGAAAAATAADGTR